MTNYKNEKSYEQAKQDMIDKTYQYAIKYNVNMSQNHPAWNDSADAFRHAFMEASLTVNYSPLGANIAGGIHELSGNIINNQDPRESNMDTWNNAVGREIGAEVKEEIKGKNYSQNEIDDLIAQKVYERLKNGELITDLDDKRDYKKDFKNRKNNTNMTNPLLEGHIKINEFKNKQNPYEAPKYKVYTFEEIKKMKPAEFLKNQSKILSEFTTGKIMHESEAKEKVQSGELIYVQPYQRSDGTDVRGYYRKR